MTAIRQAFVITLSTTRGKCFTPRGRCPKIGTQSGELIVREVLVSEPTLRVTAVKLDPVRRAAVEQLAKREGLTVSELLRAWIDREAVRSGVQIAENGAHYKPAVMRKRGERVRRSARSEAQAA